MDNLVGFLSERRELIKRGEGCISHLYLDTVGKVTIAVGNMLPDADAAVKLAFIVRATGQLASETEIRDEFAVIQSQLPAKLASSYKQYTKLDLSDTYIDQLLERRIDEFEHGLQASFTDYSNYPSEAKLALMDMAFNLGNSGLIHKFPTFTRAARAQDWQTCAQECQRSGISQVRNDETKNLFDVLA